MKNKLKIDKKFTPYPVEKEDELYRNGYFVFNITRIIKYIQESSDNILLEEVAVDDFYEGFSRINESHVETVDVTKPVILAEIAPGRYNLIDGNHRMEKARRQGIKNVPAYRLNVEQHITFLTSRKAYEAYVDYWNGKLEELE